jgi:alkylated DNA nucleotide flippase Atl1
MENPSMPKLPRSSTNNCSAAVTSDDLVQVLRAKVHTGRVTTYAEVSEWAYGVRNKNQPVRSLLRGAYNNGNQILTNRVVKTSGELASLPEGTQQQLEQLRSEDVPITEAGSVDFKRIQAVVLGNFKSASSAA